MVCSTHAVAQIWNAPNCGMVVLDKDPTSKRQYRINTELSDPIKSSIDIKVTLKEKEGRKSQMIFASERDGDDGALLKWLEVPQPRLHQFGFVKKMISEQYGAKHGFDEQDILTVQGHGAFAGKLSCFEDANVTHV